MDRVLVDILGEDCHREIKLFAAEEIDEEAFWSLDKETLVEIGKIFFSFFSIFVFLKFMKINNQTMFPNHG